MFFDSIPKCFPDLIIRKRSERNRSVVLARLEEARRKISSNVGEIIYFIGVDESFSVKQVFTR